MRRHGGRCGVPGCTNHRFLDVHHLDPRAEGGSHDPERLVVVCGAHHKSVHLGRLCIEGSAGAGFRFRHADGTPYGESLRPGAAARAEQAFAALRALGFGHTRARALVDAVGLAGGADDLEGFVRAALEAS
jgi:hypothetical protein